VRYDLGAEFRVSGIAFWNVNALKEADITLWRVSTNNIRYDLSSFEPRYTKSNADYRNKNVRFIPVVTRYIELAMFGCDIKGQRGSDEVCAIGEVAFRVCSEIPL
jgi:hypothetical protein